MRKLVVAFALAAGCQQGAATPEHLAAPPRAAALSSASGGLAVDVTDPADAIAVNQGGSGAGLRISSAGQGAAIDSTQDGGRGLIARALSTASAGIGVWGLAAGADSTGVLGEAPATSGATYGVRGKVWSSNGTGLWGVSLATAGGVGVRGDVNGAGGIAVSGRSSSATGIGYGGWFESVSPNGSGVFALAAAPSGPSYGLRSEVRSPAGIAARLESIGGGQLLAGFADGAQMLSADAAGNVAAAGTLSGAVLETRTSDGARLGWTTRLDGTGKHWLSLVSSGNDSGFAVREDGQVSLTGVGGNPATPFNGPFVLGSGASGQAALIPDSLDTIHSYTGQSGSQYHLRLSRAQPDNNGASDFLITPYSFGMALEYAGVFEAWVGDFSVHMNHQVGDPNSPARFWVGDENDNGGLFVTAHDAARDVILAADQFDHTSHGSLRLQVRNVTDGFRFETGAMGSEVARATLGGTDHSTLLQAYAGAVAALVAVDATTGAVSLGSSTGAPVQLTTDGKTAGATLGADGSFSVGSLRASTARIGGGPDITGHLSVVAPVQFPTLPAGGCQVVGTSVLGAADGDTVALGVPSALGSAGDVTFFGWAQAGIVSVRACNHGQAIDLPLASLRIDVWKHATH